MQLLNENLENLTSLWRRYGASVQHASAQPLYTNTTWPFRWWSDWSIRPDGVVLQQWPALDVIERVRREQVIPAVLSVWVNPGSRGDAPLSPFEQSLLAAGWGAPLEQTAMVKVLGGVDSATASKSPSLVVSPVREEELSHWAQVSGAAFGYTIDAAVLAPLLQDENVQLLKGERGGQLVATALLLRTGPVMGLHQMSVDPGCQGQGIASALMAELEQHSRSAGVQHMVLQASAAGRPLYAKRGFQPQLTLRNYLRLPS